MLQRTGGPIDSERTIYLRTNTSTGARGSYLTLEICSNETEMATIPMVIKLRCLL
jgi:hypothetical protein